MLFSELILVIMKAVNRQRTISSPYHLIKGKKSGQTIQDIGYFGLYPYFGVLPKLDKKAYDQAVQRLFSEGYLLVNEQVVDLSQKALESDIAASPLNGWKYRGKENLFFNRLSLIVQTFSHTSQQIKIFDPIVSNEDVQSWVKKYLKRIGFRDLAVARAFKEELLITLTETEISETHKMIVMERLTGSGLSGLTWRQIADSKNLSLLDVQLMAVEALHGWMAAIERSKPPLLIGLMDGIIQQSSLTETAQRTEKLFGQGFSLEQIASLRQLKTSTIEDHFVELAMNDPHFNYMPFINPTLYKAIIAEGRRQETKRLREIKEHLPEASYFQIRLALAIRGKQG
ncbi:helix-turn-helix domain-containing protein [Planococcus sp. ISL-110]|uniref:helix-turn-helix domain-containing protein n=1 Tax=Planococcus sp. ISL-110 TaxID=2819167 RepID=UPI001BE95A77|nr:helix-turn-helix domain-containing protein [Planococcus sp. ISL-110]MBT2569473.1 helix-turn-helix domain-containing protein [Planococcus sp. ISL-110]